MDVLDKIVNLILQDPFLTATEIAHRLGYAEEKTVYYWVEKARYPGLVAFKRAVLNGQYRSRSGAHEASVRYGRIPIIDGFGADGVPLLTDQFYRGGAPDDTVRYAWHYPGSHSWIIIPGDWLLLASLDQCPCPGRGWCVAMDHTKIPVIRILVAAGGDDSHLLVPENYQTDPFSIPLYLVRHIFRSLD